MRERIVGRDGALPLATVFTVSTTVLYCTICRYRNTLKESSEEIGGGARDLWKVLEEFEDKQDWVYT